jgi:hypothetical protein
MATPRNLKANGNPNNSTNDERVIWEDGTWAIIEAGDHMAGMGRSKTRDSIGDALSADWDPANTAQPGPSSVQAKKLIKVKLADLLANPVRAKAPGVMPKPADFGVAPPSPFMPKPWAGHPVPEFPHVCVSCGGRYYQGFAKTIHESTEHTDLRGACPGPAKAVKKAKLWP